MTESTEKKTLKLEAGKRYINRQGWITPPLQFDDEFEQTYPFVCGTDEAKSWTPSGKYFSGDEETGNEDSDDLIAEFVVDGSIVPGGWKIVGKKPDSCDPDSAWPSIMISVERIEP